MADGHHFIGTGSFKYFPPLQDQLSGEESGGRENDVQLHWNKLELVPRVMQPPSRYETVRSFRADPARTSYTHSAYPHMSSAASYPEGNQVSSYMHSAYPHMSSAASYPEDNRVSSGRFSQLFLLAQLFPTTQDKLSVWVIALRH
jgi:hypothetical protein